MKSHGSPAPGEVPAMIDRLPQETPNALAALLRWEESGAVWVPRAAEAQSTVVDLISCDDSEVMGRLVSSNPEFVDHVRTRSHGLSGL